MNFVEQATLKLNDQSSSPLRKINRELKLLFKTANALKSKNFTIRASLVGYNQTIGQLKTLNAAGASLAKPIRMKVNNAALTRTKRLLQDADYYAKQLNGASINVGGGGGRGKGNGGGRNNGGRNNGGGYGGYGGRHLTLGRLITGFAVVSAVMNVQNAVFNTAKEGYSDVALAEGMQKAQQFTPAENAKFNASTAKLAAADTFMSPAQIRRLLVENSSSTLNPNGTINQDANEHLTKNIISMVKHQRALGKSFDDAFENAYQYSKAGATKGQFVNRDGTPDYKGIDQFFELAKKIQVVVGKEADGQSMRLMYKYLKSSKFAMNDESMIKAALYFEEMTTTASVALNQFVKQASGRQLPKEQRLNQEKYGLRVKGKTKDQALLDKDPFAWIDKVMIPAMVKAGFDPTDPTQVKDFASQNLGNQNAIEMAVSSVLRSMELAAQAKRANDIDTTIGRTDRNAEQSPFVAGSAFYNQASALFGTLLDSLTDGFIVPGGNAFATMMQKATAWMTNPDGTTNGQNAAVVGGGVVGAGLGVGFVLKKTFDLFTGTGANTSATLANTDALIANTLAQGGIGGVGVGDGKKGLLKKLMPAIAIAGAGGALIAMNHGADPDNLDRFPDDPAKDATNQRAAKYARELKAKATADAAAYVKKIADAGYIYPIDRRRPGAGPTPDKPAYTPKNESNFSLDGNQLTEKYADSISAAGSTFGTNATLQLAPAGTAFGTNAQGGLIAGASAWGQQAGAALAAAIAGLQIGVNAQGVQINPRAPASVNGPAARARPDTGSQSIKAGPR